jgi:hypothetical protein
MPYKPPTGPGRKPPKWHPPKPRHHRSRKGKGRKGHKGRKPKGPPTIHARHVPTHRGAGDPGMTASTGAVSASGGPRQALEVEAAAVGASVDAGLLGAVWHLAGPGDLSGAALSVWQREQDRLANRAWRRPGGLARMGGL